MTDIFQLLGGMLWGMNSVVIPTNPAFPALCAWKVGWRHELKSDSSQGFLQVAIKAFFR